MPFALACLLSCIRPRPLCSVICGLCATLLGTGAAHMQSYGGMGGSAPTPRREAAPDRQASASFNEPRRGEVDAFFFALDAPHRTTDCKGRRTQGRLRKVEKRGSCTSREPVLALPALPCQGGQGLPLDRPTLQPDSMHTTLEAFTSRWPLPSGFEKSGSTLHSSRGQARESGVCSLAAPWKREPTDQGQRLQSQ